MSIRSFLKNYITSGQQVPQNEDPIETRVREAKLFIPNVFVYQSPTIECLIGQYHTRDIQDSLALNDSRTHPKWYTAIISALESGKNVTLEDQEARKLFSTDAYELFNVRLESFSHLMPAYLTSVARQITGYVNRVDTQGTALEVRKTATEIDVMCNRTLQPHEQSVEKKAEEMEARLSNVVRFLFPVSPNSMYSDNPTDRDISTKYRGFEALNIMREEVKFVLDVYSQARRYCDSFQKVAQGNSELCRG